jgi:hypothetical protein
MVEQRLHHQVFPLFSTKEHRMSIEKETATLFAAAGIMARVDYKREPDDAVGNALDALRAMPVEKRMLLLNQAAESTDMLRRKGYIPDQSPWCFDMSKAPRNGTLLQLLVQRGDGDHMDGFDDSNPSRTMGFNDFDNTQVDRWQFPGWNWSHDFITTQGDGTPIGWALMLPLPTEVPVSFITDAAEA